MTKCAICGKRKCVDAGTQHLLASFDLTFDDQGRHGAGLGGGALHEVQEIRDLLDAIRSARVRALTAGGASARPPIWIRTRPALAGYFKALGNDGFDVNDYQDLQEATDFLPGATRLHGDQVRSLLGGLLIDCGWVGITTDDEDYTPMVSSAYALWWDDDAPAVASELGKLIKRIVAGA